jgi:L-ribulose-5-phosphate 4-epimerase
LLDKLKSEVYEANMRLWKSGLVLFTWGNVSGIDRERGVFVIKPSGVAYDDLTPDKMVAVNLDGSINTEEGEGLLKPSSDTMTHAVLYNAIQSIGGVTHTHSTYASAFAQAGIDLPAMGTTHADYFYGAVPCTRAMRKSEILNQYERETGKVIIETFAKRKLSPQNIPAVLVREHAPFTWGESASKSVENSIVLEECAKMALLTMQLMFANMKGIGLAEMDAKLLTKHFTRKHGDGAYYGQK